MPHCNITITIPTNLFERREKVRGKMDVSYICKHSLNAAVTTEENKLGILSKREAAIATIIYTDGYPWTCSQAKAADQKAFEVAKESYKRFLLNPLDEKAKRESDQSLMRLKRQATL